MTDQQNDGEAKAIEHDEAAVALQAIAQRPCSEKTKERLELLELYRQQQQARDSELEAVRLELESERKRTDRIVEHEAGVRLKYGEELTALRARTEEAEKREKEAWEFSALRKSELAAANARAGRLEERLRELLVWIYRKGRIENHGHRKPGTSCIECQLINAAEVALSAAPQASTVQPAGGWHCSWLGCQNKATKDMLCYDHQPQRCPPIATSPFPQVAQASGEAWHPPESTERVATEEEFASAPKLFSKDKCNKGATGWCFLRYGHLGPHLFRPEPAQPKPPEPLPDYVTRGELAAMLFKCEHRCATVPEFAHYLMKQLEGGK